MSTSNLLSAVRETCSEFVRAVGKEGEIPAFEPGYIIQTAGVALGKAVVQKFLAWASSNGPR